MRVSVAGARSGALRRYETDQVNAQAVYREGIARCATVAAGGAGGGHGRGEDGAAASSGLDRAVACRAGSWDEMKHVKALRQQLAGAQVDGWGWHPHNQDGHWRAATNFSGVLQHGRRRVAGWNAG